MNRNILNNIAYERECFIKLINIWLYLFKEKSFILLLKYDKFITVYALL